MHRQWHNHWLENDPDYKAAFQYAYDDAIDLLEAEARRRIVEGIDRPVFHNGKKVAACLAALVA